MRIEQSSSAVNIQLPNINNEAFELTSLKGKKVLVTFFRFAGCPFCNLRVNQLIQNKNDFGDNFEIVGIFDASVENLQKNLTKHNAPFILLADKDNQFYKAYGVERSVWGVIKSSLLRLPHLLYSMFFKGNYLTNIGGNLLTMPASFLIDEQGMIKYVYYGKDEFDHIPFEQVISFSKNK